MHKKERDQEIISRTSSELEDMLQIADMSQPGGDNEACSTERTKGTSVRVSSNFAGQ